jgi:hypothetical protein
MTIEGGFIAAAVIAGLRCSRRPRTSVSVAFADRDRHKQRDYNLVVRGDKCDGRTPGSISGSITRRNAVNGRLSEIALQAASQSGSYATVKRRAALFGREPRPPTQLP